MVELQSPTFGTWLKAQRQARDLTQKELAAHLACAEITVRKIEADRLRPSKHLAHLLMQKLGVPRTERAALIVLARRRP